MHKHQTGAALIVSLMLLIVLTLLGLSGMQSTIMQERMSSNVRDKGMAFQAAESAIRAGEDWVRGADTNTLRPNDGGTCTPPCNIVQLDDYANMTTENFSWWQTNARAFTFPSSTSNSTPAADPRFIVEYHSDIKHNTSIVLGGEELLPPRLYRITAIGVGATTTAEVMIETLWLKR